MEEPRRAIFYKHMSSFGFKPYLNILNISKFRYSMTNLRVSSHILSIESGRWSKPNPTPLSERSVCSVICWKMSTILFWNVIYKTP